MDLKVNEAMEVASQNCGTTDLRFVSPTGDFMLETQKEIERVIDNPYDINFNNWLPVLAAISARGEMEAALVLQYIYDKAVGRGYFSRVEEEEQEEGV